MEWRGYSPKCGQGVGGRPTKDGEESWATSSGELSSPLSMKGQAEGAIPGLRIEPGCDSSLHMLLKQTWQQETWHFYT